MSKSKAMIAIGVTIVHESVCYGGEYFKAVNTAQDGALPDEFFALHVGKSELVKVVKGMGMAGGGHGEGSPYPVVKYHISLAVNRGQWYAPWDQKEYVYLGESKSAALKMAKQRAGGELVVYKEYTVIGLDAMSGGVFAECVQSSDTEGAIAVALGESSDRVVVAVLDGHVKEGSGITLQKTPLSEILLDVDDIL